MSQSTSVSRKPRVGVFLLLLQFCVFLRVVHTFPAHSLVEKVQRVDKEQSDSDFAEELMTILREEGYARARGKRHSSNCPGACTPLTEEALAAQFNSIHPNPYDRCLNLVKINVTLNGSTAESVYMGIGSTFESRCIAEDDLSSMESGESQCQSQCEQTRQVVDLNEVYFPSIIFPRYIIELDCKGTDICIPTRQQVDVSVLDKLLILVMKKMGQHCMKEYTIH